MFIGGLLRRGLGDFCLELHSTKANKREVIHELARSLDASLQAPAVSTAAGQRLPRVRQRLTEYVQELHKPFGALNLSPYQVLGKYGAVINAPHVKYSGYVETIDPDQMDQTTRELTELGEAAALIGDPRFHPWRETAKSFYSEEDFETVIDIGKQVLAQLDHISGLSLSWQASLGWRRCNRRVILLITWQWLR